jgi:hypothetical protein
MSESAEEPHYIQNNTESSEESYNDSNESTYINADKSEEVITTSSSSEKDVEVEYHRCFAVRSIYEPYQCAFSAMIGEKYCVFHRSRSDTTEFYDDYQSGSKIIKEPIINPLIKQFKKSFNNKIKEVPVIDEHKTCYKKQPQKKGTSSNQQNMSHTTYIEETPQFINKKSKYDEVMIMTKMLILDNETDTKNEIEQLLGPAFPDPTVSVDEIDPVTFDDIWYETINGKRVCPNYNPHINFSYTNANGNIKIINIFTLHNMYTNNVWNHPLTSEALNEDDVIRAKKLIEVYENKLNMFVSNISYSLEYKLKIRTDKLFAKYNQRNIPVDSKYILNINDCHIIKSIINNTVNIVNKNKTLISPNYEGITKISFKSDLVKTKKQLVNIWYELENYDIDGNNSNIMWIILKGMAPNIPEIKQLVDGQVV